MPSIREINLRYRPYPIGSENLRPLANCERPRSNPPFHLLSVVREAVMQIVGHDQLYMQKIYAGQEIKIRGVKVVIDIPEDLGIGKGGENSLCEICLELITNGIKYSDETKADPFLKVSFDASNGSIVFEDNGIGIIDIKKALDGIRENRKPGVGGNAVGYFKVRTYLKQDFGWEIKVESVPNYGTKVIIIPKARDLYLI